MLKRSLLILQLCLSFSLLLYFLGFPFFGTHFFYQSELLLVESAMGNHDLLSRLSPERAESTSEMSLYKKLNFPLLPYSDQALLLSRKQAISDYFSLSAPEKLAKSLKLYASIPLSLWIWIFLAIFLSICLLLGKTSVSKFLFLLPFCAALYGLSNTLYGIFPQEMQLFPSELELKEVGKSQDLKTAWENYLLEKWGNQGENRVKQLALAEQKFQMKWVEMKSADPASSFSERVNPYLLLLFFLWNLYFVYQVKETKENKI